MQLVRINPAEFEHDTFIRVPRERQFHHWVMNRLDAEGFRIIRHTFKPCEVAEPFDREELTDGVICYRQWPAPAEP
ncbi:hypothetical protein MGN01_36080 [Methylobacterium gnaphalii]|uniref:Uncharacterized protein n=1 Tax=Methylobacterium gnaphalii TaxID=1010610 RepID=A0A512JPH2_9HYPH|nr:hypothetical protein MGN01_36080 [Methylobacterium gnaphalii]GLS49602.1 hypothetical protein GCM10007885_24510 [Methylobacterium gnaphalii]